MATRLYDGIVHETGASGSVARLARVETGYGDLPRTLNVRATAVHGFGRPEHPAIAWLEVDDGNGWRGLLDLGEIDPDHGSAGVTILKPGEDLRVAWEITPDEPATTRYWRLVLELA